MKPDYGFQIGGEYKKAGDAYLSKNDPRSAKTYYAKAVQYQSTLAGEIATQCFNKGDEILKQDNLTSDKKHLGFDLMDVACVFDNQYQDQFDTQLIALYKDESRKIREQVVKKYNSITGETKSILTPPPVWKVIPGSEQKIVGKGMGRNDYVSVDLKKWLTRAGQAVQVDAEEYAIYYSGKITKKGKEELFKWIRSPSGKPVLIWLPKSKHGIVSVKELVSL